MLVEVEHSTNFDVIQLSYFSLFTALSGFKVQYIILQKQSSRAPVPYQISVL